MAPARDCGISMFCRCESVNLILEGPGRRRHQPFDPIPGIDTGRRPRLSIGPWRVAIRHISAPPGRPVRPDCTTPTTAAEVAMYLGPAPNAVRGNRDTGAMFFSAFGTTWRGWGDVGACGDLDWTVVLIVVAGAGMLAVGERHFQTFSLPPSRRSHTCLGGRCWAGGLGIGGIGTWAIALPRFGRQPTFLPQLAWARWKLYPKSSGVESKGGASPPRLPPRSAAVVDVSGARSGRRSPVGFSLASPRARNPVVVAADRSPSG